MESVPYQRNVDVSRKKVLRRDTTLYVPPINMRKLI